MVITDEIRRRLRELNRGKLRAPPSSDRQAEKQPKTAKTAPKRENQILEFIEPPVDLPGQEIQTPHGVFLLIRRDLSDIWRAAERFTSHYCLVFKRGAIGVDVDKLHPDMKRFCEVDHRKMLYLDIETCGLSAVPVFLVGVQYLSGERMIMDQLLARDYSEEKPLLHYFWERMKDYETVVTYNGKSFDLPFLKDRSVYHRVPFHWTEFHFDLIHEARRRYKGKFPNCKLQTLEARICNRQRRGDIPGALIPKAYHDFVRTKDAQRVKDIIHHNALDIVTMSEVLLRLLSGL
ncbi:ribonuclease H-like domain-containing protein [bacterium]|nr:ribonuclease H-like domain-containing protein [bacterium]